MKERFTIFILILLIQTSFGQTNYEIRGLLTDCSDSSGLIYGFVHLIQNDSIVKTAYTTENGHFEFNKLPKGNYKLKTDYYYYPNTTTEISLPTKQNVKICLIAVNPDSLLKQMRINGIYTKYYFGMPKYSDQKLNEIGKKYGV